MEGNGLNWLLLATAAIFYFALHRVITILLQGLYPEKRNIPSADSYTISERSVSAIQGVMACCAGSVIISTCRNDVMADTHWLTNSYAYFGFPYFYYDAWAMYQTYWHKTPAVQTLNRWRALQQFVRKQPLMIGHHMFFPALYLPIIVWLRQDRGDFFVGCFYMIELAIPCLSLRAVLLQLKQENSLLYLVNGLTLIPTFAVCRVLIFPYMYWVLGQGRGLAAWQVPAYIPIKCNVGCAVLLVFQLYWLYYMVRVAVRTIRKRVRGELMSQTPKLGSTKANQ